MVVESHGDEAKLDRAIGRAFVGYHRVASFFVDAGAGGIAAWVEADVVP